MLVSPRAAGSTDRSTARAAPESRSPAAPAITWREQYQLIPADRAALPIHDESQHAGRQNSQEQSSCFLRLCREGRTAGSREPIPAVRLFAQTLAARGGEFVKLGPPIVLRRAPPRLEQSLTYQAKQTWIEGTLFDQQCIARDLSDTQKEAVPVQWAERDRPQDEEIERARKKQLRVAGHQPSQDS